MLDMIFKKIIQIIFYSLISGIVFSQTQEIDNPNSVRDCDISTKQGIECLIKFSQNNSYLNPDSNKVFINDAIGILKNNSNYIQYSKLLFIKGNIFFHQRKYVEAIKCLKEINEIKKNKRNYQLKQEIYSQLGLIYQRLNYPQEANFYYLKSLDIQNNKINDSKKICDLYVLLGHTQIGLQNFEKSLDYYEESLNIAEKTTNNNDIIRAYINIGNLLMRDEKYNKAEELTKKTLELSIKHKFDNKITICYVNLAKIYTYTKKSDKAIEYFKKTIESVKTDDLLYIIPLCYKNLAIIYSKQKNDKNKEKAIINHYRHIQKYNSGIKLAQSLRAINSILKNNTNYLFANKYLIRNTELLDSILKSKNRNKILMIESLHELEKEKLIRQKQLTNLKSLILLGLIISILLVLIIVLLSRTRKRIMAQSNQIVEQNKDIQSQNEEIRLQNEELSKYKNHLEELIVSRTEDLKISLEEAEESNRLKSIFLDNISHEIRTPMNAILGFSQLLEFKKSDPNKKYLEIIDKNVNKLLLFLDNIVELSKIQSGNKKLIINKITVLQFLKKIESKINSIKANLAKDNIEFELINNQINDNDSICTDEVKLYRVLLQIIENAFKFTEKGKIKLICESKSEKVHFTIEDSGVGIKETMLPYIFDTFRKIEDGKKVYSGTGIGLALAKKNIELLKGEISVSSEPNKGSKFTIIIPNLENKKKAE